MRRFSFRFQRILEIKERVEESAKIALGEAIAVLNREQDLLAVLQQTRRSYQQASQRLPAARLDSSLLSLNASYLLRLQREIGEQQEYTARVEAIVEDRRQKLLAATRDRQVYGTLRDRAWETHQHEQKRQERILLDEVGKQLYVRRGSEARS